MKNLYFKKDKILTFINVFRVETFTDLSGEQIPFCVSALFENEKYYEFLNYHRKNDNIFILFFEKIIKSSPHTTKFEFFVHNLNYDGVFILKVLTEYSINFEFLIKEKSIYFFSFNYLSNSFFFRCSFKSIPVSTEELYNFDGFFLKKKSKFFSHEILTIIRQSDFGLNFKEPLILKKKKSVFRGNSDTSLTGLTLENQTDVDLKYKILEFSYENLFSIQNLIQVIVYNLEKEYSHIFLKTYSCPAFSYKIFFKYFNDFNIKKNLNLEDFSYIKNSFFGGRCEVFGNPKEGEIVNYFDFSGMYGQCMLQKFPLHFKSYEVEPDIDNFLKIGFHTIEYFSDNPIPVLPQRKQSVLFINGTSKGTYWYEEIILFKEQGGTILKVMNSYIFEENQEFVFKNFVNYFNKFREKGGLFKKFGKLTINSLYGGFALKEDDFFIHITFSELEAESIRFNLDVLSQEKIGYAVLSKIKKNKKSSAIFNKKEKKWLDGFSNRNLTYASIISSKARIKLYQAFVSLNKNGGRLLYCDTDSIYASHNLEKEGEREGEILWNESLLDAFFVSSKFYGFIRKNGEKVLKIKGIQVDNFVDYDLIKEKFYNNEDLVTFKDQKDYRHESYEIYLNEISKNVSLQHYNKRVFDKNKKNSQALKND